MPIDPLIAYGLISGVGSLASGLLNNSMSQSMSKDLMKYQYDLQQQAIDKQNTYNTPANQMKRLAEAGLNPNLVYGSGVDGNQSSAASPGIANRRSELGNPLQDMTQGYLQAQQIQSQLDLNKQQVRESQQRADKIKAETLGILSDNSYKDKTLDDRVSLAKANLANKVAHTDQIIQQTNNLKVVANNLVLEGDLLAAREHLTQEQALTEVVRRNALDAGIRLTDAQISRIAAEIPYIRAGQRLREQEHEQKELIFEATDELNKWLADHPGVELTYDIISEILSAFGGGSSRRHKVKRNKRHK